MNQRKPKAVSSTNHERKAMPQERLITELPLIRRYARHNEAEDNAFRAIVKQGLPLSNADLDSLVQTTTRQVWSGIDCLACGNCCKTLQVIVDDADIALLSSRLGLSNRQFKSEYVALAPDGVRHLSRSPCPFLGEDNACAVYDVRPQACRDFPYLLDAGFRRRTLATLKNVSVCPIVFNVWHRLKRRFRATLQPHLNQRPR